MLMADIREENLFLLKMKIQLTSNFLFLWLDLSITSVCEQLIDIYLLILFFKYNSTAHQAFLY